MKTTVKIDPELHAAAVQLAQVQQKTLDELIAGLLRHAIERHDAALTKLERHNGVVPFKKRPGRMVTVEDVQQIIRDEGI